MDVAASRIEQADRPAGRPRDARLEGAIIQAALDLLQELGFAAVTVDAVAARAGVGKATIYRRWPTKEALLVDAAGTLKGPFYPTNTGDLRTDLVGVFNSLAEHLTEEAAGCLIPDLVAEAARNDDMQCLLNRFTAERRAPVLELVQDAVDSGVLKPHVDPVALIDAIGGALFYRKLLSGHGIDPPEVEKLVDLVLAGLLTE